MRHIGLITVPFALTAMLAGASHGQSRLLSPLLRAQEQRLAQSGKLHHPGRLGLVVADRLLSSGDLPFKKGSVNLVTTVGNRGRVVFVAAAPTDRSAPATNLGVLDISPRGKVRVHVFDQRDARFLRRAVRAALDSAQQSGWLVDGRKRLIQGSPSISENDVLKRWGGQLVGWHTAMYPDRSRNSWRPESD